ncbi:uncharacterized protein LOC120344867 [Styela clava]
MTKRAKQAWSSVIKNILGVDSAIERAMVSTATNVNARIKGITPSGRKEISKDKKYIQAFFFEELCSRLGVDSDTQVLMNEREHPIMVKNFTNTTLDIVITGAYSPFCEQKTNKTRVVVQIHARPNMGAVKDDLIRLGTLHSREGGCDYCYMFVCGEVRELRTLERQAQEDEIVLLVMPGEKHVKIHVESLNIASEPIRVRDSSAEIVGCRLWRITAWKPPKRGDIGFVRQENIDIVTSSESERENRSEEERKVDTDEGEMSDTPTIKDGEK